MSETSITPGKAANLRRRGLLITALAMVIVYILWNVPALDFITYPLRLFVTYVHEAGHSLAALVTGGQVQGFQVSPNGSGLATTAGGTRAIILPAGYLGAAAFGSLMLYVVNRFPGTARNVSVGVGLFIAAMAVMFAVPDRQTGIPLALFIGLGIGGVLVLIGARLNLTLNLLVLNVLALMTALNAVLDLLFLTRAIDASLGFIRNDAVAFSEEVLPLVPPTVIAIIWAILALMMLAAAVWYGIWKPLHGEINNSYDALRGA